MFFREVRRPDSEAPLPSDLCISFLKVRPKEDIAYISKEDGDLWTTMEVQQIGHSVWHFRRNFASPSPNRDKTLEFRSMVQR